MSDEAELVPTRTTDPRSGARPNTAETSPHVISNGGAARNRRTRRPRQIRSVKPAEQRDSLVHSQLADIEEFEDYADARCIAKLCEQMREEPEGRRVDGIDATRVRRHRLSGETRYWSKHGEICAATARAMRTVGTSETNARGVH